MRCGLLKLPHNRVRRNYAGGAGIDALQGKVECKDTDQPEEWIGSMVEATNPGLPLVEREGLSIIHNQHGDYLLRDIIEEEKQFYLGDYLHSDGSWQLSFLFKILDSAMRLHVQVHPTTEFANRVLNKPYGKLECYYILAVRPGIEPYIRLGFQHAPTKEAWSSIIENQDMTAMDGCFEKIPVAVGQVWYIPGGMPHAIGEGITMLEIMEPSDLVVRCEFEREGIVVPPAARFMGRGLEFCLDIFDYQEYSKDYILDNCCITPRLLGNTENYSIERLVDQKLTDCFFVDKLVVRQSCTLAREHVFALAVVCDGGCVVSDGDEALTLQKGDSFVIAAAMGNINIDILDKPVTIVMVTPGESMKK